MTIILRLPEAVHSNRQQTSPTHKITLRAVPCQISAEAEANTVAGALYNDSDRFLSFFSACLFFSLLSLSLSLSGSHVVTNTLKFPLIRDEILVSRRDKKKTTKEK